LINYTSGKITQKWAATYLARRFRQLRTEYKTTDNVPVIGVNIGRPKREVSDEWKYLIKQEYETYRLNALYMGKNNLCKTQDKDGTRVEKLYMSGYSEWEISFFTGIPGYIVREYIDIIRSYENEKCDNV
jgi:hypothetical protein